MSHNLFNFKVEAKLESNSLFNSNIYFKCTCKKSSNIFNFNPLQLLKYLIISVYLIRYILPVAKHATN